VTVFINSMFILLWSLMLNTGVFLTVLLYGAVFGVDLSLAALLTCFLFEAGVCGGSGGLGLINMSHFRECFLTTLIWWLVTTS